ncbi:MAG: pilus assembly protein [Acidisphaera sp.]|nr:pilus assembly protein [Acidisphaera sp.]
MRLRILPALRRWRRDRAGSVTVETAIVVSVILVPLAMGAADFGVIMNTQARLDRALTMAAEYAWNAGSGATVSAIQSAAQTGYGTGAPSLTATAVISCYCVAANGTRLNGTAIACTGSCSSPNQLAEYVTLTASTAVTLPAPSPFFHSPDSLSASGVFRIQ